MDDITATMSQEQRAVVEVKDACLDGLRKNTGHSIEVLRDALHDLDSLGTEMDGCPPQVVYARRRINRVIAQLDKF